MTMYREITDLLAEEQRSLMSSDYAALERIVERKEVLCSQLSTGEATLSEAEIRRVLDLSSQNQGLLLATEKGMRAARAQLGDASESAHTYSSDGERAQLARGPRIEKKI